MLEQDQRPPERPKRSRRKRSAAAAAILDEDEPLAIKKEKLSTPSRTRSRTKAKKTIPVSGRVIKVKEMLLSASEEVRKERRRFLCDAWTLQIFSDVSVVCGLDGGLVKTSRLVLSGLSKYLCQVFLDHDFVTSEEYVVMMPDVDSKVLYDFLDNVCMGLDKVAVIDPTLKFLGFGHHLDEVGEPGSGSRATYKEPDLSYYLQMSENILGGDDEDEEDTKSYNDANDADYNQPDDEDDNDNGEDVDHEDDVDVDDDDADADYKAEKKSSGETHRKKRKKEHQSLAWNFFVRLNDSLAKCTVCGAQIRGKRGSTTGMLTHVKSLHKDVYLAAASEQGITEPVVKRKPKVKVKVEEEGGDEDDEPKRGRPPKIKRSFVWSYFVPVENDQAAMCFTCGDVFKAKAGNTTNLISHLRFKHPDVYEQVRVSQNEEHLVKARQKLLDVVPKSLNIFSGDGSSEEPLEMSPMAVKSSPVWTIFKPDDGNNLKAKCSLCQKFLFRPENSTELLINHVRNDHQAAFDRIRSQLENPDQPDPLDPANPIRDFYAISDQKYAQCKHCLEIVSVQESGVILIDHVTSRHPDIHAAYKSLCAKWRKERNEEFLVYQRNEKNNVNPLEQIWNYFDKTDNKYQVSCKSCQAVVLFSEQSLVEINEHIEQDHFDIYFQFLSDTTGIR